MELIRSKVGSMQAYGINVDETQLALILLANIEVAAGEDYGWEFHPALQNIRHQYPYNHVQDAASLDDMLRELAGADAIRKLKDAPPPTQGAANAVAKHIQKLSNLFGGTSDSVNELHSKVTKYASAVELSDSESSGHTRSSKARKQHKGKYRHGGDRRARSTSRSAPRRNKCPHCKLLRCRKAHPNTPEERCYFNKKWKGFRPDWVCKEMEVKYIPRHKFSADLGGYPDECEEE